MAKDRTDPHRPSVVDPAEYVFVGAADDHPGDSYLEIRHDVLAQHGVETGTQERYSSQNVPFYDARPDGRPNFRCHHCGKHGSNIRYFCFFLHKPSKQVIVVGQICAKKLSLGSREELDFQKRAAEFRRMQERHRWVENHPEVYAYLKEYSEQHAIGGGWYSEFFESLWNQIQQRGELSEKQVAGLDKWMSRGKPWARDTRAPIVAEYDADRHKSEVTRTQDGPTDAQWGYIQSLAEELGETIERPATRLEASNMINDLKTKKHLRDVANNGATEGQRTYINGLMEKKQLTPEQRQEARRQFDTGLTKQQASRWIDKLLQLDDLED